MSATTARAHWGGPFAAEINGTLVKPGDVVEISKQQAEDSGHWNPVGHARPAERKSEDS